jgi:hypothetical protein
VAGRRAIRGGARGVATIFLLQRLIGLLALLGLIWALRRLIGAGAGAGAGPQREVGGEGRVPRAVDESMVRDRVCNTFLPRSRALTLADEHGEHFFCSEHCRKAYLERVAG